MASERLQIIIDATFKGKKDIEAAGRELKDLDDKARKASEGTRYLKEQAGKHLAAMGMAFGVVSAAGYATWKMLEQGAELELAASRFDKLTASIGTTSDAMMTDLRAATGGMISNAEAMSSASQIISLGLADNQQDVVDLASLVSQLGWDMQQVIMTFANNSKMRLDALGLSVTDVEERAKALEAQGYNTDKAFDLAVIQAGQAKLELLGSAADTTAGRMKKFEANVANLKDNLTLFVADGLGPSVEAMNTLMEVYGEAPSIIGGIVDAQIAEADSVQELIDLYDKLQAQRGIGSLITGTTGDLADNMDKVRDAIYDASASADEYAKSIAALGIPGIEANRITEEMAKALYDAALAEYEATRRERERIDVLERAKKWAEANASANERMASQYRNTSADARDLTMSIADMNWHQEEAYEGMVNSTAVLEENRAATAAAKTAYDEARESAAKFAEAQDEITRARTQDFLTATTKSLVEYTTTTTWAGGRTAEQQANFEELSTAAERVRDNIRSLQGGTAGLGLTTEELNKKLGEQYENLDQLEAAMGPLSDIQREMVGSSSGWSVNLDLLNQQMGDYIVAADGSAELTGLWMVATGELSKEQYNAAMQTLIMQESMKALAEQYANGDISLGELQTAMDDLVAGSPYAAEADIDTKDAQARMEHLQAMLDGFDGRHVRATATVDNRVEGPPQKGGGDKPDPSAGSGAYASGTGGWVTVPPGYPNDTYRANLSSGEMFNVIPAGQKNSGGVTINVTVNGGGANGYTVGRQVATAVAEQMGRLV